MDDFQWQKLGAQEKLHWAARDTAKRLGNDAWHQLTYETRTGFRSSPPGQIAFEEGGEPMVTGLWCQMVCGTLERNRGRFQSLLMSAFVSSRDDLECADALWSHLAEAWDWPITGETPTSLADCKALTTQLVTLPPQLEVERWRAEAKQTRSRRDR